MRFTPRVQRLRLTWLLAPPFLLLARPTPPLLVAGALLALPGLLLRSWASGYIHKDTVLAVDGPFAQLRHPLYVGSFLVGLGLVLAAGRWVLLPAYLALFVLVYGRTLRQEEAELDRRFGSAYAEYRRRVPAFLPLPGRRWAPWEAGTFKLRLYLRNREWEAPLGVGAGFGLLALKMVLT